MTTITTDGRIVTMINTIRFRPEHQARLIELMIEVGESLKADLPALISVSLHRGLDGTRVVNYQQWRSQRISRTCNEPTPNECDRCLTWASQTLICTRWCTCTRSNARPAFTWEAHRRAHNGRSCTRVHARPAEAAKAPSAPDAGALEPELRARLEQPGLQQVGHGDPATADQVHRPAAGIVLVVAVVTGHGGSPLSQAAELAPGTDRLFEDPLLKLCLTHPVHASELELGGYGEQRLPVELLYAQVLRAFLAVAH